MLLDVRCGSMETCLMETGLVSGSRNYFISASMLLWPLLASAQAPCGNGLRVEGTVSDPSGAIVPRASVKGAGEQFPLQTMPARYLLSCETRPLTLRIHADGFADQTLTRDAGRQNSLRLNIQLTIESVETQVQVNGETASPSIRVVVRIRLRSIPK